MLKRSRIETSSQFNVDSFVVAQADRFLVRKRRGRVKLNSNDIKCEVEAASGFEPLHRGFADLSLNHLGTPPSSK